MEYQSLLVVGLLFQVRESGWKGTNNFDNVSTKIVEKKINQKFRLVFKLAHVRLES